MAISLLSSDDASTLRPIIASTSPAFAARAATLLCIRATRSRASATSSCAAVILEVTDCFSTSLARAPASSPLTSAACADALSASAASSSVLTRFCCVCSASFVSCRLASASCRSRATACAAACTSLPRPIRSSDACSRAAACRCAPRPPPICAPQIARAWPPEAASTAPPIAPPTAPSFSRSGENARARATRRVAAGGAARVRQRWRPSRSPVASRQRRPGRWDAVAASSADALHVRITHHLASHSPKSVKNGSSSSQSPGWRGGCAVGGGRGAR